MRTWPSRYTLVCGLLVLLFAAPLVPPTLGRAAASAGPADAAVPEATQSSGSQNVTAIGQIGGVVYAVAADGHYAYVGAGLSLVVLDVSDPTHPVVAGKSGPLTGIPYDIKVAGSYAYVAGGTAGLFILSISDPLHPVQIGAYKLVTAARRVAVQGSYAYVAAGYGGGLVVINVGNPTTPVEAGHLDITGWTEGVAVSGAYAYVSSGAYPDAGLHVVDVSDPAMPVQVGLYSTPGWGNNVVVDGAYAYLAGEAAGLRIIDVSHPASPTEAGHLALSGGALSVAVAGAFAYVVGSAPYASPPTTPFYVVGIADPHNPAQTGSYDMPDWFAGGPEGYSLTVAGDKVYAAAGAAGLRITDVSAPAAPTPAGSYVTLPPARRVTVGGGRAYLSDAWDINLHMDSVADPAHPQEISSYAQQDGWAVRDVALAGPYAYVAAGGLTVLNVSGATPAQVGYARTQFGGWRVKLSGATAYVGGDGGNLYAISIADPAHPRQVGSLSTWPVNGMDSAGTRLYLAASRGGLRIIDIADAAHLVDLGSYATSYIATGVVVSGTYAFLAERCNWQNGVLAAGGLHVVDVSDPAHPTRAAYLPGCAEGVAASGNMLYIAAYYDGLRVLDISNPAHPAEIGHVDMAGGHATGVSVSSGTAYVSDEEGGLVILRYAAAPLPTPTPTFIPTPGGGWPVQRVFPVMLIDYSGQ